MMEMVNIQIIVLSVSVLEHLNTRENVIKLIKCLNQNSSNV